MSPLRRFRDLAGGRASLRRVSQSKARAVARADRRVPLPQAAEKLALGLGCVALTTLLLGAGVGLGVRGWLGLGALAGLGFGFLALYLLDFRRPVLASLPRVFALVVFSMLPLGALRVFDSLAGLEHLALLPLSFAALVMALVWSRAFAIEYALFVAFLCGIYLILRQPPGWPEISGLAITLAGSLAAAFATVSVRRRSSLVRIGLIIGAVQVLVAVAFLGIAQEPGLLAAEPGWWLLQLLVQGLTVGLLVSGLLPTIEGAFRVTTQISLLELGNTHEQPLLRKLLLEAPGTFHHSYIVGLLAEAAAEATGANALLARVGALYHDVGKLNKPGYFAENSPDARSRHKAITPEMSALIISAHTRDGVELGKYYGLPPAVLAFMPEHHGTNVIEYFYDAAKKRRGEDAVREENFRYPGPRPQCLETAIVMLADAVEAISRQMPDPNQTRLSEMVREVSVKRLMGRQFDECGMTLRDLDRIQAAFVRVLLGIYHTRPTYPKGLPHPLDLSQSGESRKAARAAEKLRRAATGGRG